MQRNSEPFIWSPKGLSDAIESTNVFPGAMASLSNLIPDPSTPNMWECRPAATLRTNFTPAGGAFSSAFNTAFNTGLGVAGAGFISCFKIVGTRGYGMIASSLTPGFDQPFCFDFVANAFIVIAGITVLNVPVSPPAAGAWTPPIADVIGSKVVVTHLGFGATANFFGWIDISNPAALTWNAGNLSGAVQFTQPPTFVAQFSNRAYFIINTPAQPAVVFSDPLQATQVTNATQVLTFGDTVPLNALGPLGLYSQISGIIQGLVVFKGVANMYQITGDSALGTLSVNGLNVATGTQAPLSVVPTKEGLVFLSPDGMRTIDILGRVSDPVGGAGQGVAVPFIFSSVPSRMCVAASGNVIRTSTNNGNLSGSPAQEFWYHLDRKIWSGPHSFPASLIQPFGDTFVLAPVGVLAALFESDPVQSATSSFIENGNQMLAAWQTAFFPPGKNMTNYAVSFGLLDMALSSSAAPVSISAIDPNGAVFDTVSVSLAGGNTLWGGFIWGSTIWGAAQSALLPRQLAWHQPIVFARLSILVAAQCNSSLRIGELRLRWKKLRYLTNIGAVA